MIAAYDARVTDSVSSFRQPSQAPAADSDAAGPPAVESVGHPEGVLDAEPAVVWGETLQPAPDYRIRKLRFEGYPGLWVPALLYEPAATTTGATGAEAAGLPAVLNAHGHHPGGVAADFKQARCSNLAKRGMLALSYEFLGMGETASLKAHNQQLLLEVDGRRGPLVSAVDVSTGTVPDAAAGAAASGNHGGG